jgi:DNA-binding GntR family transcriptional regulator
MGWDIDVKERVYQRLANEIFFRIYHGIYPLGAKLPSYIDIAKEAGSSPETVRKAIRTLKDRGVINKTRWGYFVTLDQEKVQEYCDNYLASLEREYLIAKGRVDS